MGGDFGGHFRSLAKGMARHHGGDVGVGDFGPFGELALQPVGGDFRVAVEQPVDQAEGPHVLGAEAFLLTEAELLDRFHGQTGHVDLEHPVTVERPVFQRVGLVPGLAEVLVREAASVDDDQAALANVFQVDLERRRVHGDQDIQFVARGADLAGAEVDLKRGDAEGRTHRRANFCREIRESREVIARQRGCLGELAASQLHAVAGVAGEAHDGAVHFLPARIKLGCGCATFHGAIPSKLTNGALLLRHPTQLVWLALTAMSLRAIPVDF